MMLHLETKVCSSCNEEKTYDHFYDRKYPNGNILKQGQCKTCYQNKKREKYCTTKELQKEKRQNKKKKCLDCEHLISNKNKVVYCRSCSNKKRWIGIHKEEKINKFIEDMKKIYTEEHRSLLSNNMKIRRNTEEFRNKLSQSLRGGKLSKLHQKIKKYLKLDELGFLSEQSVDKFFVDEINFDKKIIIEINGDHIHANPKYYQPFDTIKVMRKKYTAQEKWDYEKQRTNILQSLGYVVITIWESDDLLEHKQKLHLLLT